MKGAIFLLKLASLFNQISNLELSVAIQVEGRDEIKMAYIFQKA